MWSANKLSNNETALNVMYQLEKERQREKQIDTEREIMTHRVREREGRDNIK